jgi:hypothetical protein
MKKNVPRRDGGKSAPAIAATIVVEGQQEKIPAINRPALFDRLPTMAMPSSQARVRAPRQRSELGAN